MNHDDGLDAAREALNAAVDDLLAGAPADTVIERLPPALQPLLDAGSRLARHRRPGDAPRPGFVVGLGDQLRMDLRLSFARASEPPAAAEAEPAARGADVEAPRPSAFSPKAWWPIVLAGIVFGFIAGIVVRSGGAKPGEPLYSVKRGVERVQLQSEPSAIGRVESRLDQAWRRLGELQQAVADGDSSHDAVLVLVDDLLTAYDDVLAIAGSVENDGRALRRARADADAAAIELDRLAVGLAPPVAAALVRAGRQLRLRVAAVPAAEQGPPSGSDVPRAMPGGERSVPGAPLPTEPPSQAPSPAPSLPPEPPTSEPTGTPVPAPTPTPETPLPPTATPTPLVEPTRTAPPAEPPPGATTPGGGATATPAAPRATATRTAPVATRTSAPVDPPVDPTATTALPIPPAASRTSTAMPTATLRATATATRVVQPTPTPLPPPTATPRMPNPPQPPPTISPPTSTPAGDPPTPKPPPTDAGSQTATPPPAPLPSATDVDPGDRPGQGPRRSP